MSGADGAGKCLAEIVKDVGETSEDNGTSAKHLWAEIVSSIVGLLKIIILALGVYLSIAQFTASSQRESEPRLVEACKPLQEARHRLYDDTMKQVEILLENADWTDRRKANLPPDIPVYSPEQITAAQQRFKQLYVVELSMVETSEIARAMVAFAQVIDPHLVTLSRPEQVAYDLALALGSSHAAGCPVRPVRSAAQDIFLTRLATPSFGETR